MLTLCLGKADDVLLVPGETPVLLMLTRIPVRPLLFDQTVSVY